MGEVLRAEGFDLAEDTEDGIWAWLHTNYLPALCAADGVSWVGYYEIIEQPDQSYVDGHQTKRRQTTQVCPQGGVV